MPNAMKANILIVEDEFVEAERVRAILEQDGYRVTGIARSVNMALEMVAREKPSLVIVDILLKGSLTGIHLGRMLRNQGMAFIYLSDNSHRDTLEMAKATEPYGFLVKPFREKDLLVTLEFAIYLHNQRTNLKSSQTQATPPTHPKATTDLFDNIIGKSPAFRSVLQDVQMVAPADTSVLLLGETGTGKEVIAEMIHRLSQRKDGPMVKVNCAAMPPTLIESLLFGHEQGAFTGAVQRRRGKFEQADKGTLFLDEIGEMSLDMQVKLLRVLQDKEIDILGCEKTIRVNCRIVAATNRDLATEVTAGRFRLDLYYRLNVFPVTLPALRHRTDDIPALATHFVELYSKKLGKPMTGLSPAAMADLQGYTWPGNIRELEHIIERTVLLNGEDTIRRIVLPNILRRDEIPKPGPSSMEDLERDHIIDVLRRCKGKIAGKGGAAEHLKMHASTLNSRIKKLGIQKLKQIC